MAKKIKTDQIQNSPVSATKEVVKKATKKVVSAVKAKAKDAGAGESAPPVKRSPSKSKRPAPKAKPSSFSREDVALRAYFIAENRQKHGLPGNSATDWIEAERQLVEEAKKPTRKRTVKKTTRKV